MNIRPWRNAEKKNALINWDVTSYYSYLPAIFVHKDLKFEFLNNSEVNYAEKHQFWPETAPNGNKVIKTTMGMSVLYFPFFIISHIYSLIKDKVVANGFSKPYEIGLTFSSIFYMMIGLFFLNPIKEGSEWNAGNNLTCGDESKPGCGPEWGWTNPEKKQIK